MDGSKTSGGATDPRSRFISESAIEDARREREEAWKKAYESGDASAMPETEYDPRTLYERLKEQKQRKDEIYSESRRFSKQIRTLDPEESQFLESVDDVALERDREKRQQELLALAEFKEQVSEKRLAATVKGATAEVSAQSRFATKAALASKIDTVVAAAVRRPKRAEESDHVQAAKRLCSTLDDSANSDDSSAATKEPSGSTLNALLASYGDSSSDSEEDREESSPAEQNSMM
ncbi:hypothetical protein GGI02_003328 [Coemansia sp. RSA 2322]|uniref:FAM192A/Fyv6 N-terminal domain-containing protein n=1 Tax=Coemansia thaxteri TaxID=2663907 RepID=A0A9W8EEN4_9FUNG|nr:hypothetical protein H4R26_003405 [Coemansia thaxteri]KAJ2469692.1 hypothetical protein GGI02_003328 [Coemansia sp. RSA 2322]